jgi:hypothetical protein
VGREPKSQRWRKAKRVEGEREIEDNEIDGREK